MIPIFVGYDPREAASYHTFCESLISTGTQPIQIIPLALPLLSGYEEVHTDGSNAFIYSRFLVPHLQEFKGWAIFCDGDMLCRDDISKLWALRDDKYAVMVVKHDYETKHKIKHIGTGLETVNVSYPRKNWSSVILWNCSHPSNAIMTPEYVMASHGRKLHRFEHLKDDEIGELPKSWNWLASEYPNNADAQLVHYTLGVPGMKLYADSEHADEWFKAFRHTSYIES